MGTRRLSSEHGEFTLFFSINSPFSNFYPCNFKAEATDKKITIWNCVEQYYMYNKAVACGNRQTADAVLLLNDAKAIKRLGSGLVFDKNKWAITSRSVMKAALVAKYSQNQALRYLLFMTYGSRLVECSSSDREWGAGLAIKSDLATNPSRWRGKNILGNIMDEVRQELWNSRHYVEERTNVEGRLAIPGFATAYFERKFPFAPRSHRSSWNNSNRRNSHVSWQTATAGGEAANTPPQQHQQQNTGLIAADSGVRVNKIARSPARLEQFTFNSICTTLQAIEMAGQWATETLETYNRL